MISLYNMDCMDYLRECPDKAFDLAVVDPPYGIDIMNGGGHPEGQAFMKWERKDWDKKPPPELYFLELKRVAVNQIIWGGNYFTEFLEPSSCWLIWDKMQREFTFADFEMAWTSFDSACRAFNMSRASAYTGGQKIHPTQKPIKLYEWLLSKYAKPGQRILDTHLGSGSSAIAAHYFGCDFAGIELDPDYFAAAKARIDAETRQIDLLGEAAL